MRRHPVSRRLTAARQPPSERGGLVIVLLVCIATGVVWGLAETARAPLSPVVAGWGEP